MDAGAASALKRSRVIGYLDVSASRLLSAFFLQPAKS